METRNIINWYVIKSQDKLCGDVEIGHKKYIFIKSPIEKYKNEKVICKYGGGKTVLKLVNIDGYFKEKEKEFITYMEDKFSK